MIKYSHSTIWNEILPSLHFQRPWHSKEENELLCKFAGKLLENDTIVEIGSAEGASTISLVKASGAFVYSIDTNHPMNFLTNIKAAEVNHRIAMLPAKSQDFGWLFYGNKIGLLFVDGDHRYEGVLQDIHTYLPALSDNGYIAFHDYDNAQVKKAVDTFIESGELKKLELVDSLLVCVKN